MPEKPIQDPIATPTKPELAPQPKRDPPKVEPRVEPRIEPKVEPRGSEPNPTNGSSPPPPTGSGSNPPKPPIPLRQERLQEAEAAFAKNNFKHALEIGLHMNKRYPGMMEGWKVTVAAHCALGDLEKAKEAYANIKGEEIRRATKQQCEELGGTLAP